ncbi:Glycerophosphodiester phosphodiesterase GDE1 [Neolecta irregularis DAH-3]|uniref:Glycerophosphodiester phosphodiesterase GDE1 n=1 Tax=Neolecta irregularis (strain DAH-3) TaxID=1198029 RepID=A0A1U7LN92_NEOID|nr:Glycerophosphodiester phosphodiesterase GDE1 [Neolecta irregularis DAH-3]|eukprot:OLL24125.1 Glycerophosphodiester phosphodiesterase GDE1 [Neolecta irregularis DAH-3]
MDSISGQLLIFSVVDRNELRDLVQALLELRIELQKILWYASVNLKGFQKILKKCVSVFFLLLWSVIANIQCRLDKKLNTSTKESYLDSKVMIHSFASPSRVVSALDTVNNWLSKIGSTPEPIQTEEEIREGALKLASKTLSTNLPSEYEGVIEQCVNNDDGIKLAEIIDATRLFCGRPLLSLLHRALHAKSLNVSCVLLSQVETLLEDQELNERNLLHKYVITMGRDAREASASLANSPALVEMKYYFTPIALTTQASWQNANHSDKNRSDIDDFSVFEFILSKLRPEQLPFLAAKDKYGRTPLHYAGKYGLPQVSRLIIAKLRSCEYDSKDIEEVLDNEGMSPIHFAVAGRHVKTLTVLLSRDPSDTELRDFDQRTTSCLILAAKSNFPEIIEILAKYGMNVNQQDEKGDTALMVASRFGNQEAVESLLSIENHKAELELSEKAYNWTALFIAAVEGFTPIVELLVNAGADIERKDLSGWFAYEHAVFRGHLECGKKCMPANPHTLLINASASSSPPLGCSPPTSYQAQQFGKNVYSDPVKSFGHRYLTDRTMIIVTMGSTDIRNKSSAVKLDKVPFVNAATTQLDTALTLIVHAKNAEGGSSIIDLPIHDNINTEPLIFHTSDVSKVQLSFDIVPTYSASYDRPLGRAIALLSSVKPKVGSFRENLNGGVTVPIVEKETLGVIGSIHFEFQVVTPFTHPNIHVNQNTTYWKSLVTNKVIGHRGAGKNDRARKSLQLGENTIQSFIAAANLGASYIEFDVQLTKDHVPVIYHDFLVSETGIDAPVHSLTLEQFLNVSKESQKEYSRPSSPGGTDQIDDDLKFRRARSLSLTPLSKRESDERMKFTRDFKNQKLKGNLRGHSIQAPFTTLEEVFKTIPRGVGFNIECKYPMLDESEAEDMDSFAIELNRWVDSILKIVYDLADGRDIVFSSFHPDVCVVLSLKQPSVPILYLTEAGTEVRSDIRATSLQEAVRFASRWNLLGIVSACQPFIECPRLVKVVKESGLICVSYGERNNDPQNARMQVSYGVDAVIVDQVLAVRKGLTQNSTGLEKEIKESVFKED